MHHQCSNTVVDDTYTDSIIGTSGAKSVIETTVNGQTVSTTQGGCYTTPYYVWTTSTVVDVPARYTTHNFVVTGSGTAVYCQCTRCGMTITKGTESSWGGNTCKVSDAYSYTSTQTHYSTTMPSVSHSTYYLKTCGHNNGEILSATITY